MPIEMIAECLDYNARMIQQIKKNKEEASTCIGGDIYDEYVAFEDKSEEVLMGVEKLLKKCMEDVTVVM